MIDANLARLWSRASAAKRRLFGCNITLPIVFRPAFFVSVAYDCWAFFRTSLHPDRRGTGVVTQWFFATRSVRRAHDARLGFPLTGREVILPRR